MGERSQPPRAVPLGVFLSIHSLIGVAWALMRWLPAWAPHWPWIAALLAVLHVGLWPLCLWCGGRDRLWRCFWAGPGGLGTLYAALALWRLVPVWREGPGRIDLWGALGLAAALLYLGISALLCRWWARRLARRAAHRA